MEECNMLLQYNIILPTLQHGFRMDFNIRVLMYFFSFVTFVVCYLLLTSTHIEECEVYSPLYSISSRLYPQATNVLQ
jgi:hypothetical protein